MSAQPAVLQVVILRDGLLVGTEVFVPGQYTLGSGPAQDLRLDDAAVRDAHATLYFQNGRAAIQDAGSGALYVNGHRVNACEVRAVDEIVVGPFTLKVRVMSQRPAERPAPSPEVAALLGSSASPIPRPPPAAARPPGGGQPATVVSTRRLNAVPDPEARVPARAPHLRPVPAEEAPTSLDSAPAARAPQATPPLRPPPSKPRAAPTASTDARGTPRLFVELFWGDTRHVSSSFGALDRKRGLRASADELSPLPLYGFQLPDDFVFADQVDALYRVYVPPRAAVERKAQDGQFYPVPTDSLEQGEGQRRCVTLGPGHAVRLVGAGELSVVASVQAPQPRARVSPFAGAPWLLWATFLVFGGGFVAFAVLHPTPRENPDFLARNLSPVAVKLIAPPRPEERKKLAEKVQKLRKVEKPAKKEEPAKAEKPLPKAVAQETRKALRSVEKLAAAGPAMKDLLAAVDKLGSGPGAKGLRNDFKLSGLIGKQPIAAAGIGTFGLGGGGAGGAGIKGLEVLRGKGGGGIGALGAGNIGKGSVAGTVSHAVSHQISAQGTIDKEAVAKVINAHLHEVSSCYERALLKTPGLAGKIVLEWQITLSGAVGLARTRTSTMQSAAVESCILSVLKQWRFPPARGSGVLITYPFMFNSVGY